MPPLSNMEIKDNKNFLGSMLRKKKSFAVTTLLLLLNVHYLYNKNKDLPFSL